MNINFDEYKEIIEKIKKIDNKTDNIFKILHQETYENKHSIFLSWLLNPNASHGIEHKFAQRFFDTVFGNNILDASKIKEVSTEVRINGVVQRKNNKDKRRIDILIEGEDFTCTIENKYGSRAHGGQCKDYKDFIQDKYEQFGDKNKFVFLDIERPKDFDDNQKEYADYDFINYKIIKNILNELIQELDKNKPQTTFIKQYVEILSELYKENNNDDEYYNLLKNEKINFDKVLEIKNISDQEYEILDTDTKRFVDEVVRFYWKEKNKIDKAILNCLKNICKDSNFFKSDYGLTKEMYAYTIPVSIDFLDEINYLYNVKKIDKEQRDNLRKLEEEKNLISSLKKKLKDAKEKDDKENIKNYSENLIKAEGIYEKDKIDLNEKGLKEIKTKIIKEIKGDKEDKGTKDIYFQTVDYKAPSTDCDKLSIDILAGFVPRFAQYLCNNFTKEQADKLFSLRKKKKEVWKLIFFFYIRNGSGNLIKEDGEILKPILDIHNSEELMEILELGKKRINGQQLFGDTLSKDTINQNINIFKGFNKFLEKSEKKNIDKIIEDLLNTGKYKELLFGCTIELIYEIDNNFIDKEVDLQKIFKEKTLEGASIYGYDGWFNKHIFKES